MLNDNTPMRIVFSNLFAKLIDKHVLTVADVQEILDASDDEMNAALDKVSEEKNTEYIRIGDDVYVRDADGQGWHTIPAHDVSKYSDMSIEEAIIHAKQVADSYSDTVPNCDCAKEHRQLAEWLSELKERKTEYKAKVKELEDAIAKCVQAEKEFKSRTCKFRSPINCDFCAFHSDCNEHWKEGEAE